MSRGVMLGLLGLLCAAASIGPAAAQYGYGYEPHPYYAAPGYYPPYARPRVLYVPPPPPMYEPYYEEPAGPRAVAPARVRPRPAVRPRPVRPVRAAVVRPAPRTAAKPGPQPPAQQVAQPSLPSPFEAAGRDAGPLPATAPASPPDLPLPRPEPALPRVVPGPFNP